MSQGSIRPSRQVIRAQRRARQKAQRQWRQRQQAEGLSAPARPTLCHRTCPYQNEAEERAARSEAVGEKVKVYRALLPILLKRLSKIPDPRNPQQIKHKLTVLRIYGILCFAFQRSWRREANREMTRPVLEANLALANGMVIPWLSEVLGHREGDSPSSKQDCEQKAFQRLARRLKEAFPRLPILVLLDGLYPNGPILETCRRHHWDFMIVLQDGSLPSVWEEIEGLKNLQSENRWSQNWGNRRQRFWWVNDME